MSAGVPRRAALAGGFDARGHGPGFASPAVCEHYAAQALRLCAQGTSIGGNDSWIARHALAAATIFFTNNSHEFFAC